MLFQSLVRASRSRWIFIVSASTFVIGLLLYFNTSYITTARLKWPVIGKTLSGSASGDHALPYPEPQKELWRLLQPLLDNNSPNVSNVEDEKTLSSERWDPNDVDAPLMDKVRMDPEDVVQMGRAHASFMAGMQKQIPRYMRTKDAATRGIVSTAGGYYLPVFLVSLRMLRRTGTTLPVEVFLAKHEEYEPEICEKVLPELNAKCVILDDVFSHDNGTHRPANEISKFQYKIFAILFSSFSEVLFLDADNFPLHDPTPVFTTEPFPSTGLVTWPDFWASSVSPLYYNISRQPPVPVSLRPTTESGQLLVSKETHLQALLLSAYYNYYGPSHYYALFCQGLAGKGDKDTFLPAATVLDLPFYAVSEPLLGVGHAKTTPGEFYIFAMIQHDPIQDYNSIREGTSRVKDPDKATTSSPRPLFLHANTPKWNPKNVFDHSMPYDLTRNIWGDQSPAFADPQEVVEEKIKGVENQMWEEVRWVACELEDKFLEREWREKDNKCGRVKQYFDAVLEPKPSNETVQYKPPRAAPVEEDLFG